MAVSLMYPHMVEGMRKEIPLSLIISMPLPFMRLYPHDLIASLKAPPPQIIILGIKYSTYEF
jgi:hypothetical protein